MSNRVGSSTIYSTILPNSAWLHQVNSVKLSKAAQHRLRIIEHYPYKTRNVSLTGRHYAVTRSYVYKWLRRYDPRDLSSLENRSKRPKHVRMPRYTTDQIAVIRRLRRDYPSYSARKLTRILLRDEGIVLSAATIGRIIKRFGLYFRAKVLVSKRRAAQARQVWKQRKPYQLKADKPYRVIEFDMKHIFLAGIKHYAFVAIDIFTRQILIHLATRPSSRQAKRALHKVLAVFGRDVVIVNDNGSENLGRAYQYLKDQDITQYFARPYQPKDKPHVENVIGKLQQECLDEDRSRKTLAEREAQIVTWVNDYHFFRPHQALHYLTPDEFCAKLSLTIPRARVSTM